MASILGDFLKKMENVFRCKEIPLGNFPQ